VSRWLAAVCLLVACNTGITTQPPGKSARPRGFDNRSSAPVAVETDDEDEAEPAAPRPILLPGEEGADEPAAEQAAEPTPDEAAPDAPVRDLAAELRNALGSPVGCLTPREVGQGPDHLSISVSVTVIGTGMVTRAEVSSADLSEAEQLCMRQRALAARLPGSIEDAPRTVATAITLDRQR
jgi:hypothetical protein